MAEPMVQLKVYVPAALHRRLKMQAARSGTRMSALVIVALTLLLKPRRTP